MAGNHTLRSVFLAFLAVTLLASFRPLPAIGAGDGAGAYESAKKKMAALNASENQLSRRDCWLSVIESFGTVYLEYPDHERADDAVYMVGILYGRLYERSRARKDLQKAIEAFDRLVHDYPGSSLADDALYETAEINRDRLKDPKQAYCRYRLIVSLYPRADMASKAKARLEELKAYASTDCESITGNPAATGDSAPKETTPKDAARLLAVRSFNSPDHTRVVLDMSKATDYSHGRVKDDATDAGASPIYVDIPGAAPGPDVAGSCPLSGGMVKTIGVATKSKPLRVLISPAGNSTYRVFALTGPSRIVIDVYGSTGSGDTPDGPDTGSAPPSEKSNPKSIKVVVLDPGHGGKDPGAVGSTGYYEKTANLKIALYLKEYLENELGLTVIMTRTGDKYLDLKTRTAVANDNGADLFISIHNNASPSRSPYGISTYYLAITSDKKALSVAARENDTTIEKLSELDYILTDLVVSAKRNESSLLGKFVQEGMVNSVKKGYDTINSIGVCQGPFWVLVGAQMPSILVECSYISNVREEKRLKSDDYIKALARGIFNGVQRYIKETAVVRAGG